MLDIFEMKVKVYLIKDISENMALNEITHLIDKCLVQTDKYYDLHNENTYKLYSYNSFYPIEKDRIYKAGNIYSITIRVVDKDLYEYLKNNLNDERTKSIKALDIMSYKLSKLKESHIERLYSITPIIVKTDAGYWKNSLTLKDYEDRIKINLIKKHNMLMGNEIKEDFQLFTMVSLNNKLPIGCDYKDIRLLGDKVDLIIANNENAQTLAKLAIGAGIGEMNTRGYGFVNYRHL